jgi:hypothetical protein
MAAARPIELIVKYDDSRVVKGLPKTRRALAQAGETQAKDMKKTEGMKTSEVKKQLLERARAEYNAARAVAKQHNDQFSRFRANTTALNEFNRRSIQIRHGQTAHGLRLIRLEQVRHGREMQSQAIREAKFAETPFQQLLIRLRAMAQQATGIKMGAISGMGAAMGGAGAAGGAAMGAAGGAAAGGALGAITGRGLLLAGGGITAGIMAYSRLSSTLRNATAAYETQIKADQKLQAAINATGNVVGVTTMQVSRLASEIQRTTGIADEMVIEGAAVALQFDKLSSEAFPRALKAAVDFAAFTGRNLPDAMRLVGRGIQEPLNASRSLREANIFLSASEKKLLKDLSDVGNQAEITAFILGKFENQVKGAAEAMALESDKLRARWSDAMERMGEKLQGFVLGMKRASVSILEFLFPEKQRLSDIAKFKTEIAQYEAQINRIRTLGAQVAFSGMGVSVVGKEAQQLAQLQAQLELSKALLRHAEMRVQGEKGAPPPPEEVDTTEAFKRMNATRETLARDHSRKLAEITATSDAQRLALRQANEREDLRKRLDEEAKGLTLSRAQQAQHYSALTSLARIHEEERIILMRASREREAEEFRAHREAQVNAEQSAVNEMARIRDEYDRKQQENARKLAEANRQIVNSLMVIGGEFADAFNVRPMQQALAVAQRVIRTLEAIHTLASAIAVIRGLGTMSLFGGLPAGLPTGSALGFGLPTAEHGGPVRKYPTGGAVYGPRHSGGGVPIEVEGGENVWSRADVSRAGGQQGVEGLKKGSAGVSIGSIVVQVSGVPMDKAEETGKRIGDAVYSRIREQENRSRRASYFGVTG